MSMRFTPRTLAAVLSSLPNDEAATVRAETVRKVLASFDTPILPKSEPVL